MILPRLITAIIGIPLILISIKFGAIPFFILVFSICCFCLNEYFFLMSKKTKYDTHTITGFILGTLFLISIYFNGPQILNSSLETQITSIILSFCIIVLFLIEIIKGNPSGSISRTAITLLAIFFISWPFGHLLLIRDIKSDGEKYTYFLFLLIWFIDTGAYVVGKKFGRTKLTEKISPQKTVEGLIGSLITAVIGSIILKKFLSLSAFSFKEIIIVGIFLAFLSVISDLTESLLKREAGVKDSAILLPGHGGMLDRFDSFIFTAPFFYYYLVIFGK